MFDRRLEQERNQQTRQMCGNVNTDQYRRVQHEHQTAPDAQCVGLHVCRPVRVLVFIDRPDCVGRKVGGGDQWVNEDMAS